MTQVTFENQNLGWLQLNTSTCARRSCKKTDVPLRVGEVKSELVAARVHVNDLRAEVAAFRGREVWYFDVDSLVYLTCEC